LSQMDFHQAGIQHLLWKKRIRSLLDGKEIAEDLQQISHKDCDLGKWLHADLNDQSNDLLQMRELETVHIEIHMICNRILHMHTNGKKEEAEAEYTSLDTLSKKIVSLLTVIGLENEKET